MTMTSCIGSALMITAAGYLYDFFNTYRVAIILFAICAAVGAVLSLYLGKKSKANS